MNREELLKNAKPILFSTPMVQAILEGRKTVTRRTMKPQPGISCKGLENECRHEKGFFDTGGNDWACCESGCGVMMNGKSIYHAPYKVGDILYVRETWCENRGIYYYLADSKCGGKRGELDCPANIEHHVTCDLCSDYDAWIKWKPSIHMPKEAARIFLKVTDVRVERLQDINEMQVRKEGFRDYLAADDTFYPCGYYFRQTWDGTIKKQDLDKYGWKANPWVWVIEFERMEAENE